MTFNFGRWLGGQLTNNQSEADKADLAWGRISRKSSEVTIVRGDVTLDGQRVRIEPINNAAEVGGAGGVSGAFDVVLFGVRGHGSVPDTDIQRDDRFAVAGVVYRVIVTKTFPGEVQAMAKVVQ